MSRVLRVAVLIFFLVCDALSLLRCIVVPDAATLRRHRSNRATSHQAVSDCSNMYAEHWRKLLVAEHQEAVAELRERRVTWSRKRLEANGLCVFDACAEPESDLFGEKIVKIFKDGETRFTDRFSRGDVLVMTTVARALARNQALPKECCVVDVGNDWLTLAVGPTWPQGLWEARRLPGSYTVRLDRTAPQAPLKAQNIALELTRKGKAGEAASILVETFCNHESDVISNTSDPPSRFKEYGMLEPKEAILTALSEAKNFTLFKPNKSQEDAIAWALGRKISLLVGPPGTGKTRVAALLISTALRLRGMDSKSPPRVLAVAHSNGAADVLLEALLQLGVPAVRVGRPASVSPSVRHRTVIAMADTHPEVVALRQQSRDLTLESHVRSHLMAETRHCISEVCKTILRTAPVCVASCVGAHQLLEDGSDVPFPLVVVDEAAQTTEPGLLCALAAVKAEQAVFVGDTRQLPPTVASESSEVRDNLGVSPMARLELKGVEQRTLNTQYRMAPALLEYPSRYFYDGRVTCANEIMNDRPPPLGFSWPRSDAPLAFIQVGSNLEVTHEFGGKSNPVEAALIADAVLGLVQAGDVEPREVAVISPYSKQVQRLRFEIAARNIRDVRVGTVDSFQGQETDVVLFSAVRSNNDNEMGFLRDPRRLCVAITRARRGLVILGDQKVLRTSRHWAALIDSCQERGCFSIADEIEFAQVMQRKPQRGAVISYDKTSKHIPIGGFGAVENLSSLLDENDEFLGLFDDS